RQLHLLPTMIPKEAKPNQKETKTKPQPLSFSSLPDDIIETILARLSKWNYPNLSLVSKRFLFLLSSPELYPTRSHIGTTEPCLYFCLEDLPNIPHHKWFTLWMKPADETLADEDEILEDYSLVPVPSCHHLQHVPYFSTVAVGSDIYLIGGPYKGPPSSRVRIFDCRSHTWRDGPNMLVAREEAYAFYIDGKIYVMENGRKDSNWMEVLDIKNQNWSPLLSHGATEFRDDWCLINVFRGKIYVIAQEENLAYDPKEGTWEVVGTHKCYGHIDVWCAIEDVMFCFTNSGYCRWYDTKSREWSLVFKSDRFGRHGAWRGGAIASSPQFPMARRHTHGGRYSPLSCFLEGASSHDMLILDKLPFKTQDWREVKGSDMEVLHKSEDGFAGRCLVQIVNHGGKLLVILVPRTEEYKAKRKRRIWCAKIAFEKRLEGEIWGKLEWVNEVLTVTKSYKFLSCLVITI
ncbi:hypothetical protein F2Q69_00034578, partial [Brassica cretica]